MALLDGKFVDDKEIDPAKHKFLGTFRYPQPPREPGIYGCSCGEMLHAVSAIYVHWQSGHFDAPQYATIESNGKG